MIVGSNPTPLLFLLLIVLITFDNRFIGDLVPWSIWFPSMGIASLLIFLYLRGE